jgi:hypothetical protein
MDYQASKNTYKQIVLLAWVLTLMTAGIGTQKTFADEPCQPSGTSSSVGPCIATSTKGVAVSAVVIDFIPPPSPPPPSGGGGGGDESIAGGDLILRGRFAPNMFISVILSGTLTQILQTDKQGFFETKITNLSQGLYQVKLSAHELNRRNYETSTSLSLYVANKTETTASNIKFPPLYQSRADQFLPGEAVPFTIKTTPLTLVEVFLDDRLSFSGATDASGSLSSAFNERLKLGKYEVKLRERNGTSTLPFGQKYTFTIVKSKSTLLTGGENKVGCPSKGDFNNDCKVSIIDFSLLAYWHKRSGFPLKYDLNNDKKITIRDFSILAFYWTG